MKYYIGLDWGERKIGVAFGDDETRQAFGFILLDNKEGVLDALDMIAQEYDTDTFVMGLSGHDAHDDNTEAITAFAHNIENTLGKKVLFAPEMFSTKEAQKNLQSAGKKNIAQYDDVEAARIILQGFLDA